MTTMTTTAITVPSSCAVLCTKLVDLTQRIDEDVSKASGGAAIDYGMLELRIADVLGVVERGLHAQVLARLDIDVPAIQDRADHAQPGRVRGVAGTARGRRAWRGTAPTRIGAATPCA